ncbi:glycosyltransferase family 4 protein [Thiorhodococcus minor]|uniref:Glycosyltransferase family 4 protein n=1 Tax=Thiorhodococcus minor TaxID=57489 RepID=A0A6M0JXF2_9GAMM|nr:glycosyltransferase family 4 protein [Thiorhodococcus minor]
MKILIANKFFFRNGGSEAVMLDERHFLQSLGVEVIDFAMRDARNLPSAYSEDFVDNQSYEAARGARDKLTAALKLVHSPEAVRRLGRLIDRTQPDLVHCHNIYHQLTPSIIGAAKRRGIPVVLTLHDYKPVCPVYTRLQGGEVCSACVEGSPWNVLRNRCADGSLGKSALLLAEAWTQRLLGSYEKLDKLIAPSAFMRDSVTQRRFSGARVEVIYNGVDCDAIAQSEQDDGYALYLGRLSSEKGVETLLSAHDRIADSVELRIAGTGPLEKALHGAYPKAKYLGYLAGAALEDSIRRASVIVVPSEWLENCPMSILEAMAFGKPVIASEIGGIPELVANGETGLLFPAKDEAALREHLLTLMRNPDLRSRYGAAARRRTEARFSLKQHNQALLKLYRDVLEGAVPASQTPSPTHISAPQE